MQKLPESHEDYLKAIYIISRKNKGGWVSNKEISNFLKVKPASVSGMLGNLKKKGLISWKPRSSLRLTTEGKEIASMLFDNYNRLYKVFKYVLHLNDKQVLQEICCKAEHIITPEISNTLEGLIVTKIT